MLENFLFIGLPYVAAVVFIVGVVYRYRQTGFKVSSLSSQFLEGRQLFWGAIPFHLGLLILFLGHLVAFLIPDAILAWNGDPIRLVILEAAGFTFGLSVLVGLVSLLFRRFSKARIRAVTSKMDVAIEVLLLAQVVLGCWVALGYRWGSSWFAVDLSPYLWSLVTLTPEPSAVIALPWVIKLHIAGAFVILFMIPFTRLVHFMVAPLHYIARPYQQVIWNWNRKRIRDPNTPWSPTRPRNN